VSILDQYYIITDSYLLQLYQPAVLGALLGFGGLVANQVQIRVGRGKRVCSLGYCLNHASGGHLWSYEESEGLNLDRDRGRDLHFKTTLPHSHFFLHLLLLLRRFNVAAKVSTSTPAYYPRTLPNMLSLVPS
jgi:hypothetical protein